MIALKTHLSSWRVEVSNLVITRMLLEWSFWCFVLKCAKIKFLSSSGLERKGRLAAQSGLTYTNVS